MVLRHKFSPTAMAPAQPRFALLPSLDFSKPETYRMVLGGVRPLRVDGQSVPLKPGALGGQPCAVRELPSDGLRTATRFTFSLVLDDADSEGQKQMRRKNDWPQPGGWDVNEVQKFWEQRQVPFAVLFDGGESTQLAFRRPDGGYHYVSSGYQYSFVAGYLFQRPLLLTPPILPPAEAHRGVLNYLYFDGPDER